MAGYREKFIHTFSKVAPYFSNNFLTLLSKQNLILPVYHLVSDKKVKHITHLYSYKGKKEFLKDLDYLQKNYEPISLAKLIKMTQEGSDLKRRYFLLTFDDGLREFGEVVAPILKDRGLTAVCFLNNDFIDNKNLFFRFKISLLVDRLQSPISGATMEQVCQVISSAPSRAAICKALLTLTYHDQETITKIGHLLNLDFTKYLTDERPYLSSQEIRDLMQQGFEFGAHSLDHPEYYLIDQAEQLKQTHSSIHELDDRFNLPYKTFAFPFTDHQVKLNFFHSLHKAIPDIDLTFGSAGQKRDLAPLHFQRIPMEMGTLSGKKIIQSELLYYLLKRPFGKNTLLRS